MRERFLSYAQEYEDLILYNVLKDIKRGFYVDVGANDPWEISVTKAFYELGWNGINIEPLQDKYDELMMDRKRDINRGIGAGSEDGELVFYLSGTGTTCDERAAAAMGNRIKRTIPVKRLTDIVKEAPSPSEIHFCKIDVEGFEKSVLEGIDFDEIRPWVFVIEAMAPNSTMSSHEEWEHILTKAGYNFVFKHGCGRYYLDAKKDCLKHRFVSMEELNKSYDVFLCTRSRQNRDAQHIYFKIGKLITTPIRPIYHFVRSVLFSR